MPPVIVSAAVGGQGSLVLLLRPPSLLSSRYKFSPARTVGSSSKFKFPVAKLTLGSGLSSLKPLQPLQSCSFGGTSIAPHISDATNACSTEDHDDLSHANYLLPQRRKSTMQRNAFMGFPLNITPPKSEKKLVWWWRTLACVPYLLALQLSTVGFFLQPVLERHECLQDLIYYIPGAFSRLPTWFAMSYNIVAYCGLVRNKRLPHFFRYHLIMAMLLETAMGIVWHASNFMPLIYHGGGRFAEQYWAAVAILFIAVVLWCVASAIGGMFCNIPFFSDAAMIHTMAT